MWIPAGSREDVGAPRAEFTGSCELSDGGSGNKRVL